jgi:hypothetical protein
MSDKLKRPHASEPEIKDVTLPKATAFGYALHVADDKNFTYILDYACASIISIFQKPTTRMNQFWPNLVSVHQLEHSK